jgi:primosomal protein N' (replication factor Y)
VLSLDRPFTYELPPELGAGLGSLVQVRFHGRSVRGWVMGATDDVPERMLRVRRVVSPVRFFDEPRLELFRWMRDRYVAPLAAVIARAVPPRVASEEAALDAGGVGASGAGPRRRTASVEASALAGGAPPPAPLRSDPARLGTYLNGPALVGALAVGERGTFVLRPAPADEATVAVTCVRHALRAGRTAIVVVPEAEPLPATASAIVDAFGDDVAVFVGGDRRARYRAWLQIAAGRYRVVVGTRPAVFAPVPDLGLVYVHREGHALHREERAPYYHVRDVARARARIEGAVCVLAAFCPSIETTTFDHVVVEPSGRTWAPVEVVRPGPEGRAPRLVRALGEARRAFLFEPMRGYGVARVCRACGEPAACASCLGTMRLRSGTVVCTVCGAPGRCATCGASDFGIVRGGAERVTEWARAIASVPVTLAPGDGARPSRREGIAVGGVDAVKDVGHPGLDLVAILGADASLRRPGLAARERSLVAWFEAAAWTRPDGRVIVQTTHPNDPAVQALVSGRPSRFHRAEAPRLSDAGFPVGSPVFRLVGSADLGPELEALPHRTLLVSSVEGATVCLVALDPATLPAFGRAIRGLAERGVVTRVEAEPHLEP